MADQTDDNGENSTKTMCVIKEMLSFFTEQPLCVPDQQETWVGWDAWVADGEASMDKGESGS